LEQAVQEVAGANGLKTQVKPSDNRIVQEIEQREGLASAISDYLRGLAAFDSPEDMDAFVVAMERQGWRIPEGGDEVFLDDESTRGGYRARHVQLMAPDGSLTAEFQLLPREIAEVKDEAHDLYKVFRNPEASLSAQQKAKAKSHKLYDEAWERWKARTSASPPGSLRDARRHGHGPAAPCGISWGHSQQRPGSAPRQHSHRSFRPSTASRSLNERRGGLNPGDTGSPSGSASVAGIRSTRNPDSPKRHRSGVRQPCLDVSSASSTRNHTKRLLPSPARSATLSPICNRPSHDLPPSRMTGILT